MAGPNFSLEKTLQGSFPYDAEVAKLITAAWHGRLFALYYRCLPVLQVRKESEDSQVRQVWLACLVRMVGQEIEVTQDCLAWMGHQVMIPQCYELWKCQP